MANDGTIRIGIDLDEATFKKAIGNLGDVAKKGMKATVGAIGAASTALAGFGIAGLKVGAEFEAAMSQVGATMGMSSEEIRNGSKDFKMLEKAAMDAGKSTKFSAKESAEALNYLALAGYDANKSVEALPVVLDLAAAGGLDLAYASDLVTDSMSALGLETSDLSGFTDELAKTSQKSNTSVAQLGEAILTVGGTAKNLAGGTVELNTALGLLADNGIKGAEGGTALRNIILSLSAPMDKAAAKMKELGVEAFDADGNMRPLNETFQDLDGALAGLTQEDKINALSTIFNNRDLKAATALLANSGQRFDELSGYIEDADSAATKMAITMNDNLKGSITILQSSLEGLGVEFYKSVDTPAKEVVNSITGMVSSLTSALTSGGLEGLVSKIGDMFADVVLKVASFTPKMIDAAVELINSFLKGITENSERIGKGGIAIAKSLLDGIKSVTVSFADAIGSSIPLLNPLTDAVKFLVNNLEYLVIVMGTAVIAFKSFTIISAVSAAVQSLSAAYRVVNVQLGIHTTMLGVAKIANVADLATLSAKSIIMGTLAGRIKLAAAAQGLWNIALNANPIGLVVTAVAALAAGIAILVVATKKADTAEIERKARIEETIAATEELTDKMNDVTTAYENNVNSIQNSANASLEEIGYVKELTDELHNLADENGNVDEANKGRAAFILGELNSALNTEYQMIGNQIMGYSEMKDSIYDLIKAEEARIVVGAKKEMLTAAIKAEVEARKIATDATAEMREQQEQQNVVLEKFIQVMKDTQGLTFTNAEAIEKLSDETGFFVGTSKELANEYQNLDEKIEENTDKIKKSGEAIIEVADLREEISNDMVNLEEKNYDAINTTATLSASKQKEIQSKSNTEKLFLIDELNDEIIRLTNEKAEAQTDAERAGWQGQIDKAIAERDNLVAEYEKTGEFAVQGFSNGMEANKSIAANVASSIAEVALAALRKKLEEASPSKATYRSGVYFDKGFANGINDTAYLVTDAAEGLAESSLEASKGALDGILKANDDMAKAVDEKGKKLYKSQEDINKKLYEQAKEFINLKAEQNELSAEEELELWKYVGANFALNAKEQIEVEKNKNKALDNLRKEQEQAEKDGFENSKKWIERKKKLNQLSLAEEYQAWQRVQARYAEGTSFRAEADENLFKVKEGIIDKINKLEQDYTKAVESRTKQIYNVYSLFETIEPKEIINGEDMLKNLNDQVVALRDWSDSLQALAKRGIDEGLLAELEQMGPEASEYIDAFLRMSDTKLTEYVDLYKEKSKLANDQAVKEFEPMQMEVQKNSAELIKGIEAEFEKGEVVGSGLAENLVTGFEKGIKNNSPKILNALNDLLDGIAETPDIFFGTDSILKTFAEASKGIKEGFAKQIATIDGWSKNIEEISTSTIENGLLPDLEQATPQAAEHLNALLDMTNKALTKYSGIYKEQSKIAREKMMAELAQLHREATQKTADIIRSIENEFSKAPAVGLNMALGLAKGIREGMSEVINAAIEVAKEAIRAAKDELDINSPSKVFNEIGKFVDEGFAEGINDNICMVDSAMNSLTDTADISADINFNAISDDLYMQGKSAGNDFFDGFLEALHKVELVVNATLASMTPQFALNGINNPTNSVINNHKNEVTQNFYTPMVTPYDAYRRAVLHVT